MKLKIKTKRKYQHWQSWDLVYEWEDTFQEEQNLSLYYASRYERYIDKLLKITKCYNSYLSVFSEKNTYNFMWEMIGKTYAHWNNRPDVIPCIIDFFLNKDQLDDFLLAYKRNPLILISSKEAFAFLKNNNFPKPIYHFPLSISDKYRINLDFPNEKKYDLVLMGRQNLVLTEYLNIYKAKKQDFIYVYRKQEGNKFLYYTSDGKFLGNISTREEYLNLMRKSKIGFYSTPGIDGGEERTQGFNQVTPRFLELIACGCHIIARYKENPDTDFYELNQFSPHIDSFESFERAMDIARTTSPDLLRYANYLEKHYTSTRVALLKEILNKNNLWIK
jgi:hypothetical protein